jgi:hypothetical protein
LPVGGYREVAATLETALLFLQNYEDTDELGGMIFCDISVPPELHDILDLAPVAKRAVDPKELTQKQRDVFEAYNCKLGDQKLMPFLGRQYNVAHHVALLQLYVGLGVRIHKVTKIRRPATGSRSLGCATTCRASTSIDAASPRATP